MQRHNFFHVSLFTFTCFHPPVILEVHIKALLLLHLTQSLKVRWWMNNELETIWKEVVMASLDTKLFTWGNSMRKPETSNMGASVLSENQTERLPNRMPVIRVLFLCLIVEGTGNLTLYISHAKHHIILIYLLLFFTLLYFLQ
jgi:hypothetical protein